MINSKVVLVSATWHSIPRALTCMLIGMLACSSSLVAAENGTPAKPNMIPFFADDLRYGDIGCFGPCGLETPNLDSMAAEGLRCTNVVVPANVCGGSRAALPTERYPMPCGLPVAIHEVTPKHRHCDYADAEITIPDLLRSAGCRSLMVGKWHLGMEIHDSHPLDAGLDQYLRIPSSYEPKRGPS